MTTRTFARLARTFTSASLALATPLTAFVASASAAEPPPAGSPAPANPAQLPTAPPTPIPPQTPTPTQSQTRTSSPPPAQSSTRTPTPTRPATPPPTPAPPPTLAATPTPAPAPAPTPAPAPAPTPAPTPTPAPPNSQTQPPPSPQPPPSSRPPCTDSQLSTLTSGLTEWAAQLDDHAKAVASEHACDRLDVLCLDRFGQPFGTDAPPDRAVAGQVFTVVAIVPSTDSGRFAIAQTARGKAMLAAGPFEEGDGAAPRATTAHAAASCTLSAAQREALHTAAQPIAELGARPGLESLELPPGSSNDAYWVSDAAYAEWAAWLSVHRAKVPAAVALESKVEVPAGELSYDIDFTRTDRGRASQTADAHYSLWVDNGRYHIEAAALVPFVFRGRRHATLSSTPSGSELRVGLEEDWHVTGALAFNFFPFGRQRGQVSSFEHCPDRSCFTNWLGLQVGTGFGEPLEEWYFGLVFEPVSGLALSAGASLLKGDFLPPGLSEGMLLPSASQFSVSSDYMVRPYFGLTVTTDILQTLDRASVSSRLR